MQKQSHALREILISKGTLEDLDSDQGRTVLRGIGVEAMTVPRRNGVEAMTMAGAVRQQVDGKDGLYLSSPVLYLRCLSEKCLM